MDRAQTTMGKTHSALFINLLYGWRRGVLLYIKKHMNNHVPDSRVSLAGLEGTRVQ
jgi:hypothetical protein